MTTVARRASLYRRSSVPVAWASRRNCPDSWLPPKPWLPWVLGGCDGERCDASSSCARAWVDDCGEDAKAGYDFIKSQPSHRAGGRNMKLRSAFSRRGRNRQIRQFDDEPHLSSTAVRPGFPAGPHDARRPSWASVRALRQREPQRLPAVGRRLRRPAGARTPVLRRRPRITAPCPRPSSTTPWTCPSTAWTQRLLQFLRTYGDPASTSTRRS